MMLFLLHSVFLLLWPCFCFILFSLSSAAVGPQFTDGTAAVQAEAELDKSTGVLLNVLSWTAGFTKKKALFVYE